MNDNLKSYADAMMDASSIITQLNPDFIVAPMLGSIPFIDAMAIVDSNFDPTKVVYMPASSRIKEINNVMKNWYTNFLEDIVDFPYEFPRIVGIDEVVSGSSVTRCMNAVDIASNRIRRGLKQKLMARLHSKNPEVSLKAISDVDVLTNSNYASEFSEMSDSIRNGDYLRDKDKARENSKFVKSVIEDKLNLEFKYLTIGVEDSKNSQKQKQYADLKLEGRILPVEVQSIITMDNPKFCPARYQRLPNVRSNSYVGYSPTIQDFVVTPEYIDFLSSLAAYIGKDPDKVHPVNMNAILNSSKYLGSDSLAEEIDTQ
ncbi:MAG: hypothetical protein U9Q06_02425 [Nanoarchaeota archaeon]|nr:hypothetical protein [Nanoarchaeota archaeon]